MSEAATEEGRVVIVNAVVAKGRSRVGMMEKARLAHPGTTAFPLASPARSTVALTTNLDRQLQWLWPPEQRQTAKTSRNWN